MQDQANREFSADDLALVSDPDEGNDAAEETKSSAGEVEKSTASEPKADQGDNAAASEPKGKSKSIAEGGEAAEKKPEKVAEETAQKWREEIAEYYAAGNKKIYAKELKRLEGISDVKSIWGMYRELEGKFTSGGLIKVPGKDAKPEDLAAFYKALGVPEKPEDYFKDIKLENGAVIGDADKPLVDGFAQAVHKSGATPAFVNAALNWYYQQQEDQAASLDEADDSYRREAENALKEEFGAAYKRKTNAISSVFSTAPGGANIENDNSLFARLMGGRTADGKIIGNDPDMVRWLVGIANEINPSATVVDDGDMSGQGVESEIAAIEKRMREDRRGYNKDYAMQTRYRELLGAREKIQARA